MRLGILTSHPIQYHAPWFRALAQHVDLHVYYAHRPSAQQQGEAGFDVAFDWDVDLLEGYQYTFLENHARRPGAEAGHFFGCDTPGVRHRIRDGRFDAFVVTGWYLKSFWQAVVACRRTGTPVLARGDSQLRTPRSRLKQFVKEVGYRVLLRAFDGFLSVGERFEEYLMHYGVPRARIFHAPHCVDNERFARQAEAARAQGRPARIRDELGLAPETLALLFVGKMIPKKRPQDLLRALEQLAEDDIDAAGVFVGAGPLEDDLRREAERLDALARFAGFKNQTELPVYYAMADALVLPSNGAETWGLVVNEAMACGTPALVSEAAGCAPDLIEEGTTGFTYPAGRVRQLAGRIRQLAMLREEGHDFRRAVTCKIDDYSVDVAARNTAHAAKVLQARRQA